MKRMKTALIAVLMIATLGCVRTNSDVAGGDPADGFDAWDQTEVSTQQDNAQPSQEPKMTSAKTVRIGGINWYQDYDVAMQVAKKSNKPLWLHFGENPG